MNKSISLSLSIIYISTAFCLATGGSAGEAFPKFAVHRIDQIGWKTGHTALADVDQDGDLDWLVGESPWETERRGWWWEFIAPDRWVRHDVGQTDSNVGGSSADLNADGWPDWWAGKILFLNKQDGSFSRHDVGTLFSHDSEFADLNADGRLDGLASNDKQGLYWYEIPEDPTKRWIAHKIVSADEYKIHGAVSPKATGDLDGDGDIDIVFGGAWIENCDGKASEWKLHKTVDFGEEHRYGKAVRTWVCDLDGDGDLDFVQTEADNPDGRVAWFENDGHANLTRHMINDEGDGQDLHSLVVADFDNDGDLDVFSGGGPLSEQEPCCYIWENTAGPGKNPLGDSWRKHIIARKPAHESVGGDVDGDGDIDICTKPWSTGNEHLFLENLTNTRQFVFFDETQVLDGGEVPPLERKGPADLAEDVPFVEGRLFLRFEILEKPSDLPLRPAFFIWQWIDDGFGHAGVGRHGLPDLVEPGVFYIDCGQPKDWWHGKYAWPDWTRPFDKIALVPWVGNTGEQLTVKNCYSHCFTAGRIEDHTPVVYHATGIWVAPGEKLIPPPEWADCPREWTTGGPSQQIGKQ